MAWHGLALALALIPGNIKGQGHHSTEQDVNRIGYDKPRKRRIIELIYIDRHPPRVYCTLLYPILYTTTLDTLDYTIFTRYMMFHRVTLYHIEHYLVPGTCIQFDVQDKLKLAQ
jgi:hypothetical protein